jgi:hypothetical protein
MKPINVVILIVFVLFAAVGQDLPKIKSIKLLPGDPIVVAGCKVDYSGGYLRPTKSTASSALSDTVRPYFSPAGNDPLPEPSDAEIGEWVRSQIKAGRIVSIYPDKRGLFVTTECQMP